MLLRIRAGIASVIHSVLRWRHSAKSAGNTRQAKLATYHASPDDKQLKMGTGEDSVVKLTKSDFVTCNTNQAIGGQALASGNAPSSYMVAKIPTAAELHSKGKFWMAPILASIATFPGSTWQSLSDEERIYLKSFGEKVKSLIDPILDFQIERGYGKGFSL